MLLLTCPYRITGPVFIKALCGFKWTSGGIRCYWVLSCKPAALLVSPFLGCQGPSNTTVNYVNRTLLFFTFVFTVCYPCVHTLWCHCFRIVQWPGRDFGSHRKESGGSHSGTIKGCYHGKEISGDVVLEGADSSHAQAGKYRNSCSSGRTGWPDRCYSKQSNVGTWQFICLWTSCWNLHLNLNLSFYL